MIISRPASRFRRLSNQFVVGLGYFSALAAVVWGMTGYPYWLVWLGVFAAYAVSAGLMLTWLTLWARRDDGRLGQFSVGSLLLLTVFAAMFFGLVRWLDDATTRFYPVLAQGSHFGSIAINVLLALLLSIPFAIRLTESLIWLAVWVVRRKR